MQLSMRPWAVRNCLPDEEKLFHFTENKNEQFGFFIPCLALLCLATDATLTLILV